MNLTASVSLLILGIICGCYTAFRYSKRVRELCAMETFFTRIYAELSLEQTATAALFAKLSMHSCAKTLWFVPRVAESLAQGTLFPQAFADCVADYQKTSAMTNEDFLILEKAGETIGAYDLMTQLSGISSLVQSTAVQIEEAKQLVQTKGRLMRSVFILSGVAAAVLIV